jgi:hypothetical protein
MSNTKPKPRPSARQIQKALDEDIDFYLALKAMPLEKLGPLAHHLEVLTPLFEAMLSAREELAHAEAAVAAGKKAKHEALMELVNARIAGLRPRSPFEPVEPEPAGANDDNDVGDRSPRVLH